MKMLHQTGWMICCIALLACLPVTAMAQPAKIPFQREPYFVNSGLHDGQVGPEAETNEAFHEVIWVPGVPWLRLQFEAYNLGTMDYLTIDETDSTNVRSDSTRAQGAIIGKAMSSLEEGQGLVLVLVALQ